MKLTKMELQKRHAELENLKKREKELLKMSCDIEINAVELSFVRTVETCDELQTIRNQIVELRKLLDSAELVTVNSQSTVVSYGAIVSVEFTFEGDDKPEPATLLITSDTNLMSGDYMICTPQSELYHFIEGKSVGFIGEFKSQNGSTAYTIEILGIEFK